MSNEVEIFVLDVPPVVGDDPSSESIYESLKQAKRKEIALFDEQMSIYLVTTATGDSKVNLELTYTSSRQNHYSQDKALVSDEHRRIYQFDVPVIPGRCNNELKIRAYLEEKLSPHDTVLPDFKRFDPIRIANIEFVKAEKTNEEVNENVVENGERKLISSETSIRISPIFQMLFKNIRSERMMTSLDLSSCQTVKDLGLDITVNEINVEIANCEVKEYSKIEYPLTLGPNNTLTLGYCLTSSDEKRIKPIVAVIHSTVDGYKKIVTKWTTNVDFQGPSPSSLSRISSSPMLVTGPGFKTRSSALLPPKRGASHRYRSNSSINIQSTTLTPKRGLVLSVSGQTRVKLGEAFKWNLQLINNSSEKMDLILYVQSSITKQYEKSVPPIPIQTQHETKQDTVPLFSNNQLVRSYYGNFSKVGLISLSNNLRMNLEPGNMFESELKILAIEKGLFNLHDVKLLDASSGDTFECPRLLDVLVT